jgi:hypothetical protein
MPSSGRIGSISLRVGTRCVLAHPIEKATNRADGTSLCIGSSVIDQASDSKT